MLNETSQQRNERLLKDNMYQKMDEKEQETIKKVCESFVEKLVEDLNREGALPNKKIVFLFEDKIEFGARSVNTPQDKNKIGGICLKTGTVIHLLDLFGNIDTGSIFVEEKNKGLVTELFIYFSLFFLLAHEVAHIYFGHTLLRASLLKKKPPELNFYLQIMEWDADCFAATKVYEYVKYMKEKKIVSELKTEDAIWVIFLESIHSLFYLNQEDTDFVEIEDKEHPPMAIRESLVIRVLEDLMQNKMYESIGIYIDVFEKKNNEIFGVSNDQASSFHSQLLANCEYADLIYQKWESTVRYQIKEFSYLPIETIDYSDYRQMVSEFMSL